MHNGRLVFHPDNSTPSATIAVDQWVQVVLTRSTSGRMRGYIDGAQQFDVLEPNEGKISSADVLRFFRDDGNAEESSGAVARIRLYDRPLSPSAVAGLGRLPA